MKARVLIVLGHSVDLINAFGPDLAGSSTSREQSRSNKRSLLCVFSTLRSLALPVSA